MIQTLAFLVVGVPLFAVALWRLSLILSDRLESRRHGALMARMDWTREPERRLAPKKGLLERLLG